MQEMLRRLQKYRAVFGTIGVKYELFVKKMHKAEIILAFLKILCYNVAV